jgi:hypothetical protein
MAQHKSGTRPVLVAYDMTIKTNVRKLTKSPKSVGCGILCYYVSTKFSTAITEKMVMSSDNSHVIHKKKLNCVKNYLQILKQSQLTCNLFVLVMKN